MIETLLLLLFALAVLLKASDLVVENSIVLARFFKLSDLAVGFLLVSVATSIPELVVSVFAATKGDVGLAVGNVLGSNLANIGLVLGVSTFFGVLAVQRKETYSLARILLLVSVIPLALLLHIPSALTGFVLLAVFVAFAYYVLKKRMVLEPPEAVPGRKAVFSALLFMLGVGVVLLSANYVVDFAAALAQTAGISQSFVGATLVAVSTSLPELAVTISAVRKRHSSLAFGNVLGSCITNITLVLGAAALLNPLAANIFSFLNLVIFLLIENILLWYFLETQKKITLREGLVLIGVYALFLIAGMQAELLV
ncbi:sodium:calcium antiporter [Candidatus Micrarchaeota archaeon]|nr:sodium:calcium antiporter [Candidatus Micrarchaeota archaeon]